MCKGSAFSNCSVSTYKHASELAMLQYCSAMCELERISSSEWADVYRNKGASK